MKSRGSLSSCSSGALSGLSWVHAGLGSELGECLRAAPVSRSCSASGPRERGERQSGSPLLALRHPGPGHSLSFPEV